MYDSEIIQDFHLFVFKNTVESPSGGHPFAGGRQVNA